METPAPNYFLVLTKDKLSREAMAAIFNISGYARTLFGYGPTSLWILPKSKKEKDQAATLLQAVPAILKFGLASLQHPVTNTNVEQVRQVLAEFEFDTTGISDARFVLYLDSVLDGEYDYIIRIPERNEQPYPAKIEIILLKDHPNFSPEWLNEKTDADEDDMDPDYIYTADDFEIVSEDIELGETEPGKLNENIDPEKPV